MKSRDEWKELGVAGLRCALLGGWLVSTLMMVVLFGVVAARGFEDGDLAMVFVAICFALASGANAVLALRHLRRERRS